MCMWPPPPVTSRGGHPQQAKTATTAPMTAAPMNPAENASAAPVAVVRMPALDSRPRTGRRHRARHRSRGRSSGTRRRRRRARPGCRPSRSPRRGRTPCRRRARERRARAGCRSRSARRCRPWTATRTKPTVMSRPTVAMTRGERWPSRCRATRVPTVMASANGRNASPVSRAEKPSTVWTKIEVRKTVPTRMPVTPSITAVPETRVWSFQMCGGNSGLVARCSSLRKRAEQDRRDGERGDGVDRPPAVGAWCR